ncbi:hypothetical protein VFPFJ_10666 [Purpureocillium lilacinum]|uniref:Uncharacterized protein n=1 Tax=Purpureocillium lilacinum TaxID=33203 RepID=A0A179GDM4_PURLI|nr:hypothetical protein VFPFJ_10666 [Purpureocillium lilacinum]OAQ75902.1 hypothetical protein VFPFJ_10666 [Purpureocillium lilacinum]
MKSVLLLLFAATAWSRVPLASRQDYRKNWRPTATQCSMGDIESCGTDVYCFFYTRRLDGGPMYENDGRYHSRKSCLESYKPNPEGPPKRELKVFQFPLKGCDEFRCDATNFHKSFEWRCGTPKYCTLFNNATVLENPDVSYGSERECLDDHETEEQARARSTRGGLHPFHVPDCANWNGDYGRGNDERKMGTRAWCSKYRHALWRVDSYREPLSGYASEDECLKARRLPSAEQQVDPDAPTPHAKSPADAKATPAASGVKLPDAKATPAASGAKLPWIPSRGWNPQCVRYRVVDENKCGSASYCRAFDGTDAMSKEDKPAHPSEAACLAARQTPFEYTHKSTRHLPWVKDPFGPPEVDLLLPICNHLPFKESFCGSWKFCVAQDTQDEYRQRFKAYVSAQACFDARQKPKGENWRYW